ncbi:hypothetical protein LTR05_008387 [Lithohypha guttulata]|uniref:Nudix hydrolase domain-containing protein n=1 Tax=Lithohypha guttulata TaxID=1690604 RepID=A0AAN7SMU3_9EURO|nr:hypothetical protein LTR05_008387 [Lithohypha guttulata]
MTLLHTEQDAEQITPDQPQQRLREAKFTNEIGVPRIGVGVFVLNSHNEFIFGRRKGSHGNGTWALPGGHLELHESFEDCARREAMEEIGMEIEDVQFLTATNSPWIDGSKHYVTIFVVSRPKVEGSQPTLLEPEKCYGWQWMRWEELLAWHKKGKEVPGSDDEQGQGRERELFEPMTALIEQRAGVRPVLQRSLNSLG